MEQLDGDVNPLRSTSLNKWQEADIVQFVPFRDLKNDPERLAKEVLAEVPRQLLYHFSKRRIKPNPKKYADRQALKIKQKMATQVATMMRTSATIYERMK